MYNTDPEKPPKRPLITSQAGAMNELRNWVRDNQFELIADGDGLDWNLDLKVSQIPDPLNPKGLLWQVKVGVRCEVDGPTLLKTGVLSLPADERLLAMIGSESVPLIMKPQSYEVANELETSRLLVDVLPRLKDELGKKSLMDVKRTLVGRWVDQASQFGGLSARDTSELENR